MPLIAADMPSELEASENIRGLPHKFEIFCAMKLTSFTKFQGILADELPVVVTISRQEFSHFLFFGRQYTHQH